MLEERHATGIVAYDAERGSISLPFDRWRRLDVLLRRYCEEVSSTVPHLHVN